MSISREPLLDVVLLHPLIPPNTGNVIRLCANTGCRLHLVEPLGFSLEDAQLRRAGLDYHDMVHVKVHPHWTACLAAIRTLANAAGRVVTPRTVIAVTTYGQKIYTDHAFKPGEVVVFGCETTGFPAGFLDHITPARRLYIPMVPDSRSFNLGNSVSVIVLEAWRQNGFQGAGGPPRQSPTL